MITGEDYIFNPILYKRINKRSEIMIKSGLIDEVKKIVEKLKNVGTGHRLIPSRKIWELSSMSGIGYKQVGMYLREEINKNEMIRILKRDTRHYAKRQISWFKRDKRIKWIKTQRQATAKAGQTTAKAGQTTAKAGQAEKLVNSFLKK